MRSVGEDVGTIRVGVDVGGTFTDVVTLDELDGTVSWLKVPTAVERPAEGVLAAIAATGVPLERVSHVRLGTTLGVNAVLTRTGAPTGLITTHGFRDVLEIRRTHRARLFDLEERIPEPLVPRDLRLEANERVDADGEVVTPLDEASVRAAWRTLRERGVKALAIVFLFSYAAPEHELRAREIVLDEGGAEAVFVSSEVLPVHREYERTSTTAMAAYVGPLLVGHLVELADGLRRAGLAPGRLSVLTGSGAVNGPDAIARNPVPGLLSGPAGGVTGALALAGQAGLKDALTLDMGGTSCDVSGIVDERPDERLDSDIDGLAVTQPAFDVHTIGAGGGSVAWVDSGGALRVGPWSAGADPGPACYGLGGEEPTVTDANLVLGRYDPAIPLAGALALDLGRARAALDRHVAGPLGMSVERAAAGVVEIANALMAGAVRTISLERGRDPRDFTLVAFGGAGPVHAADIASELGIEAVLVPPCPGCTSALGAALADARHDELRTIARRVDEVPDDALEATIQELSARAADALAQERHAPGAVELRVFLDLRYEGQAHALAVEVAAGGTTGAPRLDRAVAAFHELHERLYGHSFADAPVDLVNVKVIAYGRVPSPEPRWSWNGPDGGFGESPGSIDGAGAGAGASAGATRQVQFDRTSGFVETLSLRRQDIGPGPLDGPVVIHQLDATVLVPPNWTVQAHPTGSLILRARRMSETEVSGTTIDVSGRTTPEAEPGGLGR